MEITRHQTDDYLEIRLDGRLDAAWADYVSAALDEAIRGGSHRIALDLAAVTYISSMGIGVLLKHYSRLKAVDGRLVVIRPSPSTLTVIRTAGLADYLLVADTATSAEAPAKTLVRTAERGGAMYEIYAQRPGAAFDCTLVGDPDKLVAGGFSDADCRALDLPDGSIGLGLGAFGDSYADCRPRFGEFLAAGGCAVTLPTAEQDVPDYVVTQGRLVPRVQALYAIAAMGHFADMLRFDAAADGASLGFSQLIDSALHLTSADAASFAVVAEAGSVIGATLRRSPAAGDAGAPLNLPAVRDWLSFTTERGGQRHLALIVGVAARRPPAAASAFLRPLRSGSDVQGHFHAAVFPYSPVQRGELKLAATVTQLLSASAPRSVRHLMADTRAFEGVGETQLMRGACWVGAIRGMERA